MLRIYSKGRFKASSLSLSDAFYSDKIFQVIKNGVLFKAMRLTEIFDFRLFPIVESQKFSTVENHPK